MQQGYHFPPPDPEPAYGYGNQQLMPAQPQWGQPQPDPQGYELAYQTFAPADPSPFATAAPHAQQQQSYGGEVEPDYGEEYYDEEEPRRGTRWLLIVVALVGAIGVGGALAYGYRSFMAPNSGRVPVVKADPNVKAKPDFRGGKEFAGAERKAPESAAQREAGPDPAAPAEERAADGQSPRVVKSIPIVPSGAAPAPEPPAAVPGITLYRPPQLPAQQAAAAAPPPAAQQPQPAPKIVQAPPPAPPSRVVIGSRPQPAAEPDEEAPAAPPPVRRSVPLQTAAVTPRAPPPAPKAREASSGLGYVAVLSSQKSSMDALKIYADLQQKYPDVLGDKTPDVQEADLSARNLGTMYRVVVGPPGSQNAARSVCTQLKAAGYEGCWVKEY